MYKGYGVYRFLDRDEKIIYIGKATNIYTRIMNQHFKKSGHLKSYDDVARVDIIKLDNNKDCVELEQYLLDKYRPRLNTADIPKSPFRIYEDDPKLEKMEKWKVYRKLKDFNIKIEKDKSTNKFLIGYVAALLLIVIYKIAYG